MKRGPTYVTRRHIEMMRAILVKYPNGITGVELMNEWALVSNLGWGTLARLIALIREYGEQLGFTIAYSVLGSKARYTITILDASPETPTQRAYDRLGTHQQISGMRRRFRTISVWASGQEMKGRTPRETKEWQKLKASCLLFEDQMDRLMQTVSDDAAS